MSEFLSTGDPEELLTRAEEITGLRFQNRRLLQTALTHPSAVDDRLQANGRLNFVGSHVLHSLAAEKLYVESEQPQSPLYCFQASPLCEIHSSLVSGENVGKVAREMGLSDVLVLGKGMESSRERIGLSVLASTYRALIGARLLDSGLPAAKEWTTTTVLRNIPAHVQQMTITPRLASHMSRRLEELVHERYGKGMLSYPEMHLQKSPPFGSEVRFHDALLGSGIGHSKKYARQKAVVDAVLRRNEWPEK